MKRLCLVLALLAAVPAHAARFRVVSPDLPPWAMESDGKPAGLGIELVQAMAQAAHDEISIQVLPRARAQKAVMDAADVLIVPLGRIPDREANFRWIIPLAPDRFVVVAKADSPLKTIDDCRNQVVGMQIGGPGEAAAHAHGFEHIEPVSDEGLDAKKLLAGRIGCWLTGELAARASLRAAGSNFAAVKELGLVSENMMYLAGSKSLDDAAAKQWEAALAAIKANGSYERIMQEYQN
ncbi:MAG TPA: transporter substrate-binding domain-containing protein [Acetobacteraceae bacterium]|nr:transporter substrate-binding domain-containing protein [Acetobacteraceae bacterium]